MWGKYWQAGMEKVLEKVKYSFVLPAYKAKYLREAIDSIINQTYTDFELIIVNDASPEDVDSIVSSYDDARIQYYRNEKNIGGTDLVAQWNHCIAYAKGEYLILASDDDVYSLEYLEKMDTLIQRYPETNVFRCRVKRVDNSGKILQIDGYEGEYLTKIEYLHLWTAKYIGSGIPFVIFKREALMEIGGFVNYPLAWFSDDATILKLADNGVGVYSKETLFSFRYSNENISTAQNTKKSLIAKYRATRKFYEDCYDFITGYVPKDAEDEHLVNLIRKNLVKLIRKDKVKNQLRSSSLYAIVSTIPEGRKVGPVSTLYIMLCCKYPFKYFFKRKFARKQKK